ncbi:DUF6442 family protein [Lachnospiraceae bacterium 38-14]
MEVYDIEKDMDIKNKNAKRTLAVTKITLCAFAIVRLIRGNVCYDLFLIFFIAQLAESTQLYHVSKRKIDFIEIIGSTIAILGILLLYLCLLR